MKKKKKIIKNKVVKVKKALVKYKAVLDTGGIIHKGNGDTIYDALMAIPLDWTQIKYKGIIKVSVDKKKVDKFFPVRALKRLFANKLNRRIVANQLEKLLNN